MGAREDTADLMARLERHYLKPGEAMPGGIFIPECGVNGNWGLSQRADALYVGFTSGSGRILVGHEVKASRSDWRKEIDGRRDKADAWADQCHAWYIVAPSVDIVPVEELPDGWGLMVPGPSRTRMKIVVKAEVHRERRPSWNAVRSIMARYDTLRAQAIADARSKAQLVAREEIDQRVQERVLGANLKPLTHEDQRRLALLERLEEALGDISLQEWVANREEGTAVTPDHLAAAIKVTAALGKVRWPTHGAAQIEDLNKALAKADAAVAEYRAVVGE